MSAFELSNVGPSFTTQRGSNVEIESILFSQSASACSAAIKVSAVTGQNGRSALGFAWQEGVVETEIIKNIKTIVKEELERLVVSG
jgi:hypothetical protein